MYKRQSPHAWLQSIPSSRRELKAWQTGGVHARCFGMKAHIGVDADSGLVHTVVGTAANVNDVTQAAGLLHPRKSMRGSMRATRAWTSAKNCRAARRNSKWSYFRASARHWTSSRRSTCCWTRLRRSKPACGRKWNIRTE